jgi:hypothetical protein
MVASTCTVPSSVSSSTTSKMLNRLARGASWSKAGKSETAGAQRSIVIPA